MLTRLTRQEKANVILGVQRRLGCPARALDAQGRGKAINRLRNGETGVSDEKLEAMYHLALELEGARKSPQIKSVYQVIREDLKAQKQKVWTGADIRQGIEKSLAWLERAVKVLIRDDLIKDDWERFRLAPTARYLRYGGHLSEREASSLRERISDNSLEKLAEIANE